METTMRSLSACLAAALTAGCATSHRFARTRTQEVSRSAMAMAAGDVNGDGNVDLVVGSFAPGKNVAVMLGSGKGTFLAPRLGHAREKVNAVALADVDGDGKLDILTGDEEQEVLSVFKG